MRCIFRVVPVAAAVLGLAGSAEAQLLLSGNDEKTIYVDGKPSFHPPGNDTVSVIDIHDGAKPRIIANLPLMNTIVGPPTNLAITPDGHLGLVANSLDWVKDGENWKGVPDNKVYVLDLAAKPPVMIGTVEVGKQPSGMAINHAGNLALVANRVDNSLSVLSISGKEVKIVDTLALAAPGAPSEQVSAVAITPDGKRALVAKYAIGKIALLSIDGQRVTYEKYDMATGLYPYNVQITHDGKLGIAVNQGAPGSSDGQVDTAAIIDMEANPPRVIDQVVIGDGPEGLAVSPTAGYAAAIILNGTGNTLPSAFWHHDHSLVSLLKIEGKKVRKVSETEIGNFTEGVAFSPDGKYLYVGNNLDKDITVLRLEGSKLTKVGSLALSGHPASMRGSTP